MKATVLLAFALSLVSIEAHAISRYNSESMSCDRVQMVLRNEGAAILSYRSKSNIPLYDRYVTNSGFCTGSDITKLYSVPTSDNPRCKVLKCYQKSYDR